LQSVLQADLISVLQTGSQSVLDTQTSPGLGKGLIKLPLSCWDGIIPNHLSGTREDGWDWRGDLGELGGKQQEPHLTQ
jgi:hypothetical protein